MRLSVDPSAGNSALANAGALDVVQENGSPSAFTKNAPVVATHHRPDAGQPDTQLELAVSVRHTQQDEPAEPEHRRTSTTVILHLGPPCSVS